MALSGSFSLIFDDNITNGNENVPAKRIFTTPKNFSELIKKNKAIKKKYLILKAVNEILSEIVGNNKNYCIVENMNGKIIFPLESDQSKQIEIFKEILQHKKADNDEIIFNEQFYKYDEKYEIIAGEPCIFKMLTNTSKEKDYLTKILTREAFVNGFEDYLNKIIGRKGGFAFLFFDMDNFKTINDIYGHEAGDEILRVFCKIVKENIRDCDLLGRYGGDEIVLILKDVTDIQETIKKAKKIKELFRNIEIIANNDIIDIDHTVSVGIGQFDTILLEKINNFSQIREFIRNSADFYLNKCKEECRGGIVAGINGTKDPARIIKIPPDKEHSKRI